MDQGAVALRHVASAWVRSKVTDRKASSGGTQGVEGPPLGRIIPSKLLIEIQVNLF
jgi:hypothetical protein